VNIIAKFLNDENAATAIEDGPTGVARVIIAAGNGLGSRLDAKSTAIKSSLE